MCGRFSLTVGDRDIAAEWDVQVPFDVPARYNIAPSEPVVVLLDDGERRVDQFQWGLVPPWAKDPKIGNRMINARAETLFEKPAYRAAAKRRRCLVLADGFYEWQKANGGPKVPHYVKLKSGRPRRIRRHLGALGGGRGRAAEFRDQQDRVRELTPQQERVRACVQSGQPYVEPGLREALAEIDWPACYLDFETISTAVPLYPDSAPFDSVPFQYSIHVGSAPGHVDDHREFLADPNVDQRRELAESLLADLESSGSILIYSGYERTMVQKLAEQVPDLDAQLRALVERMVDLHKLIKGHVAHPDFHGSTSIKKTLLALVPEMAYDHLEISEGGDAMAQYAELVWGERDAEEAERILDDLREYCKQDTLAMVRLHEHLVELAS